MPRPKQRTEALRQVVLQHALTQLAEAGPTGLTARAVALRAGTSTAAVYELFGDKGGLIRALFFEGFRRLAARLDGLARSADPRADLLSLLSAFRMFARDNRWLAAVMFGQPFQDFSPGPDERKPVTTGYRAVMDRVRAAIDAGVIAGDAEDLALVLMSTAEGLVAAESSGRLGQSEKTRARRFTLAFDALLAGLAPAPAPTRRKRGST